MSFPVAVYSHYDGRKSRSFSTPHLRGNPIGVIYYERPVEPEIMNLYRDERSVMDRQTDRRTEATKTSTAVKATHLTARSTTHVQMDLGFRVRGDRGSTTRSGQRSNDTSLDQACQMSADVYTVGNFLSTQYRSNAGRMSF